MRPDKACMTTNGRKPRSSSIPALEALQAEGAQRPNLRLQLQHGVGCEGHWVLGGHVTLGPSDDALVVGVPIDSRELVTPRARRKLQPAQQLRELDAVCCEILCWLLLIQLPAAQGLQQVRVKCGGHRFLGR